MSWGLWVESKNMRKQHPEKFFSEEEKSRLVQAIQKAEALTSGEIRVHLAHQSEKSVFEEAKAVFEKLGMTKTKERNGILFFLSLKDRQFVILGDQGIHAKVSDEFWHEIRDVVIRHFKEEKFIEGLVSGIEKCGKKLAHCFPRKSDDKNELSDDVTTS